MAGEKKPRGGSLTDFEVSIIRGLRHRHDGISNQKILGLLNAVRRAEGRADTNGGRVSEVKNNRPQYHGIVAAADDVVDAFTEKATLPQAPSAPLVSPVAASVMNKLFVSDPADSSKLALTETDMIECKESFGGGWNNYIKAIAAFSNNRGGYLLFGVKDKTWEIIGINGAKFAALDRKDINQTLRSSLSCGIDFETTVLKFDGKAVGVMFVYPAKMKPVMFIKQVNGVAAEGQIYYRYQGENRLIGPMELQALVEERVKQLSQTVLSKHLHTILANGIENSAILNLQTGRVDGKSGAFLIDEAILPKISFIKEGEFSETTGAPTLKLIGDVTKTASVLATKTEDLIKLYPFTFKQLRAAVKKARPKAKDGEIHSIISAEKLKFNRKFSAFVFRNKVQADQFEKTGKVPNVTPSIYNDTAIQFIVDQLNS
jgi:hypothetical protein